MWITVNVGLSFLDILESLDASRGALKVDDPKLQRITFEVAFLKLATLSQAEFTTDFSGNFPKLSIEPVCGRPVINFLR